MSARVLLPIPLVAVALAACGGSGGGDRAAQRCDDTAPGKGTTLATAGVAFAAPAGDEVQSAHAGGYLSWFAKFGVYVRGRGEVMIRVPPGQRDAVNIAGWGVNGDVPPRTDIRIPASPCWTVYPGGLVFKGRQCVRLEVEGPGKLRGAARFGLRRDCGPETLTRREQFLIADAQLVFATIVLDEIDHTSCVEEADIARCAAGGDRQVDRLLAVFRAKPDGLYQLPKDKDLTVREIVATAADDLRDARPELATELDAALGD